MELCGGGRGATGDLLQSECGAGGVPLYRDPVMSDRYGCSFWVWNVPAMESPFPIYRFPAPHRRSCTKSPCGHQTTLAIHTDHRNACQTTSRRITQQPARRAPFHPTHHTSYPIPHAPCPITHTSYHRTPHPTPHTSYLVSSQLVDVQSPTMPYPPHPLTGVVPCKLWVPLHSTSWQQSNAQRGWQGTLACGRCE